METTLIESVLHFSNVSVTLGANLLAQSALLAGAGLFVAWILRHKGAALRSAVLRVTLAAILVCPLASLALKAMGVPGLAFDLPRAAMQPVGFPAGAAAIERIAFEPPEFAIPIDADVRPTQVSVAARDVDLESVAETQVAVSSDVPVPRLSRLALLYTALTGLWLVVSWLLLLRLTIAYARMWRIRSSAKQAPSALCAAWKALARDMRVKPPSLLVAPLIKSPCLIGLVRPAVLLPESYDAADALASREVIVHELAHLARRDCVWNLLGRVAGAALFFQPLVWRLGRRIEDASDDLADDCVLQKVMDRRRYANLLADIAESFQPAPAESLAGVGVINFRPSLDRRVERILDTTRGLSIRIGLRTAAAVIVLALCATLAAGFVGVGRNSPLDPEELLETARAYVEQGASHEELGESEQAVQAYSEALRQARMAVELDPTQTLYRKMAIDLSDRLALALLAQGRDDEAGQTCDATIALFEHVSDEAPGALYDLLCALHTWVNWLNDNGREEGAQPLLSKAEAYRRELVAQFPSLPFEIRRAQRVGGVLDYVVRVTTPGEYRLHVRAAGHDTGSDSFHAWIEELCDGPGGNVADIYLYAPRADADFGTGPWLCWAVPESYGAYTRFTEAVWPIPTSGDYTIRLMVHEDGAAIDALALQRSNLPAPTGYGPGESAITAEGVFLESGGRVVVEAEHFTSRSTNPRPSTDTWMGGNWLVVPDESFGDVGYRNVRGSYVQALPDLSLPFEQKMVRLASTIEAHNDPMAYRERGYSYYVLGQYEKTIDDFSMVIELDPDNTFAHNIRASAYAQMRQFDKAAIDFTKLNEVEPDKGWAACAAAFAQLAANDAQAYRDSCVAMLELYGRGENPANLHWAAWTCILVPEAVSDLSRPVQLAEMAVQSDPSNFTYVRTLGAALYRAGTFEESLIRLQEVAHRMPPNDSPGYAWFFLAMAHHQLGHDDEAQAWLEKAVAQAEVELQDNPAWNRKFTFQLLREEAEAMINGEGVVVAKND